MEWRTKGEPGPSKAKTRLSSGKVMSSVIWDSQGVLLLKRKNLPFSIEDIRRIVSSCKMCFEIKPKFYKHTGTLIKATAPFERLSIDFKGPLPLKSHNQYLLTVVDEYSRFPFAFSCSNMTSDTVIACFKQLFTYKYTEERN